MNIGVSLREPERLGCASAPASPSRRSSRSSCPRPHVPALAVSGDSYVVVTQAENGTAVDLPTDGALAVVLQTNGGTGYEWRTTQAPSLDVIALPADVSWPYTVSDSSLLGAPVSWVWYFPVQGPGETTFSAALYPPGSDVPAETFSLAILVRAESGATATLIYDQCGDIVGIDSYWDGGDDDRLKRDHGLQLERDHAARRHADGRRRRREVPAAPGRRLARRRRMSRTSAGPPPPPARPAWSSPTRRWAATPPARPARSPSWPARRPPARQGDSWERDDGHAAAHVHARHGGGQPSPTAACSCWWPRRWGPSLSRCFSPSGGVATADGSVPASDLEVGTRRTRRARGSGPFSMSRAPASTVIQRPGLRAPSRVGSRVVRRVARGRRPPPRRRSRRRRRRTAGDRDRRRDGSAERGADHRRDPERHGAVDTLRRCCQPLRSERRHVADARHEEDPNPAPSSVLPATSISGRPATT